MNSMKPEEKKGNCPQCHDVDLVEGEGKLDQSGQTHLVTKTWTCNSCGYKRWDPAPRGALAVPNFPPEKP
jgi:C4-type Zn-finger protein